MDPNTPAWFRNFVETKFDNLEKKVDNLEKKFDNLEKKVDTIESKVALLFLFRKNQFKGVYSTLDVPSEAPDSVKGDNAPRIADLLISGNDWLPKNGGQCRWSKSRSKTLLHYFQVETGESDNDADEGSARAHVLRSKCLDVLGVPRSQQQLARTILESEYN